MDDSNKLWRKAKEYSKGQKEQYRRADGEVLAEERLRWM